MFVVTFTAEFYSQDYYLNKKLNSNSNSHIDNVIFQEIENGIVESDVSKIARYFSPKPYLSFSNGVTGYYSSNQAYYVLEDFINIYKVISFKFDHKKNDGTISYATGIYYYESRGKRDSAQVYLTLSKIGDNWFITQISIN
ncbi:MAG: DUF4783 domain-containing protein [Ignavibacteriaceae bacterium]|nr:DUF4783 domain-containing protein [Ignavibacteriaceae bacterium]